MKLNLIILFNFFYFLTGCSDGNSGLMDTFSFDKESNSQNLIVDTKKDTPDQATTATTNVEIGLLLKDLNNDSSTKLEKVGIGQLAISVNELSFDNGKNTVTPLNITKLDTGTVGNIIDLSDDNIHTPFALSINLDSALSLALTDSNEHLIVYKIVKKEEGKTTDLLSAMAGVQADIFKSPQDEKVPTQLTVASTIASTMVSSGGVPLLQVSDLEHYTKMVKTIESVGADVQKNLVAGKTSSVTDMVSTLSILIKNAIVSDTKIQDSLTTIIADLPKATQKHVEFTSKINDLKHDLKVVPKEQMAKVVAAINTEAATTFNKQVKENTDAIAPTVGDSGVLTISSVKANSLILSWAKGSDNITDESKLQYQVYKSTKNNIDSVANAIANGDLVGSILTNINSILITDLKENTNHYFNVTIQDAQGNRTPYINTGAKTLFNPPGAPIIQNISHITKTSLTLSWIDKSSNETGFKIQRLMDKAIWKTIATVDVNVSNYEVIGLKADTSYYFRVIATNESGDGIASKMVLVRTMSNSKDPTIDPKDPIGGSTDYLMWNLATLPITANWQSITFGNGIFVAIASGSNIAATSTDGINWVQQTLPSTTYQNWSTITFGNGLFIALQYNNYEFATSPDGETWTSRYGPYGNWSAAIYANDKFISVGYNVDRIMTSVDGISWNSPESYPPNLPGYIDEVYTHWSNWLTLAYGSGVFVTLNSGGPLSRGASSSDGINWDSQDLHADPYLSFNALAFGSGRFVGLSADNDIVVTSTDGSSWTASHSLPSFAKWSSVVYGSGHFVAVATDSGDGAVSTDGIIWKRQPLSIVSTWKSIAYGNGVFVAVASGGNIVGVGLSAPP